MRLRVLKLTTAFVTVIDLHIEILGLIMRIFLAIRIRCSEVISLAES